MSNHYTHRQMPPQAAAPSSRFHELIDALKAEYENNTQDAGVFKVQRDEFDHKINAQINELSAFQQTVYELELTHQKVKKSYEDEIVRLRRELEQRGGHPANGGPSNVHPQHPPPNIGNSTNSLFASIVGGPPQLMDPSQGQQQQPQPHPSFPPPTSNPTVPPHYINGGPQGGQQLPPSHPNHPQGGPGMHLPKRLRADSDASALPMIQHGPPSSMAPGYPANMNQPPGPQHHNPPGMHPHQAHPHSSKKSDFHSIK
ncbi:hypothetical protein K502DRAFT_97846 [Neoconidiobolus thromboides FSU 785]|nr:hypothetical protein K502DRAFT_97846 [Neoconidiobolus thromboides FSU 785]